MGQQYGVPELLHSPAEYGPSLSAFNTWKRHGIPTSQLQQSTSFGCSTKFEMGRSGKATLPARVDPRHTARNPITWQGGELMDERDQHARVNEAAESKPQTDRPQYHPPSAPFACDVDGGESTNVSQRWLGRQAPGASHATPHMKEEHMKQTWGELMRNGSLKPSAAMSLVVRTCEACACGVHHSCAIPACANR